MTGIVDTHRQITLGEWRPWFLELDTSNLNWKQETVAFAMESSSKPRKYLGTRLQPSWDASFGGVTLV